MTSLLRALCWALALCCVANGSASAQQARAVSNCGAQNLKVGDATGLFVDSTGTLCTVSGSGGGSPTGSVTAAGTNGTLAQAVQGINGGVPLPITGSIGNSFLLDATFTGRINTLGQKTGAGSTPVVLPSDQTVPISAAALPLPAGAATAARQPAFGTAGASSADVVTIQGIAGGTPQPISAGSLPLPSGAATSANQSTEIAALGAPADAAYAGSGSASIVAALKGNYNALLAPTPAGTNTIGSLANINGTVSLPTGAATSANQATEISSLATIATRMATFPNDISASIGASATQKSPVHDAGTAFTRASAVGYNSQTGGSIQIYGCSDAACGAFFLLQTASIATAGGNAYVTATLPTRYWQVWITNGSTAGTAVANSSQTAN